MAWSASHGDMLLLVDSVAFCFVDLDASARDWARTWSAKSQDESRIQFGMNQQELARASNEITRMNHNSCSLLS
jgi:hypothetical protein